MFVFFFFLALCFKERKKKREVVKENFLGFVFFLNRTENGATKYRGLLLSASEKPGPFSTQRCMYNR